jgi:hypothetical protein
MSTDNPHPEVETTPPQPPTPSYDSLDAMVKSGNSQTPNARGSNTNNPHVMGSDTQNSKIKRSNTQILPVMGYDSQVSKIKRSNTDTTKPMPSGPQIPTTFSPDAMRRTYEAHIRSRNDPDLYGEFKVANG